MNTSVRVHTRVLLSALRQGSKGHMGGFCSEQANRTRKGASWRLDALRDVVLLNTSSVRPAHEIYARDQVFHASIANVLRPRC